MTASRRGASIAAALLLASLSPSCSRDDGWDRAACSPARPHEAGFASVRLQSGGIDRSAALYVPDGYTGEEEVPVVLSWHGLGSSAEEHLRYADMLELADDDQFLVVAPQGTGSPSRFNLGHGITSDADDVRFALDLLDTLERDLCVGADRVHSTGVSNGAGMSERGTSERIMSTVLKAHRCSRRTRVHQ